MVERITDPHRPVQVHGVGRLADGDTVPQPPAEAPPPVNFTERLWAVAFVALVVFAVVVGALR